MDFRFSGNFWFLVPISRGGTCSFCPPSCGRPWWQCKKYSRQT